MRINAKDYFPITPNTTYIYSSNNSTTLNFKRYTDFYDENKIQVKFANGKTEFSNIYEYSDSGVNFICCKDNYNYHQNFLNSTSTYENYLIKAPIIEGNSWKLPNGSERCITNTNADVNTRYKLFKNVLEITTLNKNSEFAIDYYVIGIGLIKSIYYINNVGLICSELENIIEDSSYEKTVKIFFPDKDCNSLWISERKLNFYTNDNIGLILSKELELSPKGLIPLINCNTKINAMYYNLETTSAFIDFSSDILEILNENKKASAILASIYKTIENYYNTKNIFITINNIDIKQYFYSLDFTKLFSFYINKSYEKWFIEDCNFPLTYIVKANDTLLTISRKFNIDYKRLAKLNNISNPNFIPTGTVLQIYSNGIYSIKDNETLDDICNNFNLNKSDIINLNNISNLSLLTCGQKIKLYV